MTDTGAVYDLGYEPYEGERRGRSGARRTIIADGIRRILGLRRKILRKVMPWGLVVLALIPAIVAVGLAFFLPASIAEEVNIASENANFFVWGGTIAMLFAALSAPELFIPDRRDGVLSMLSSRPLTSNDYVFARFAGMLTIVGGFLLLPQFVLYIGQAGTDPDGILAGMVNAADTIPRILAATCVYAIAFVPLAFAIAAVSKRKAIAASVYIAVMIFSSVFADVLVRGTDVTGGRFAALLAPIDTANTVTFWIFGEGTPSTLLETANIHPAFGLLSLGVIGGFSLWFVIRRYRKLL
jgi:ABC-2 type transport system permease protein